MSYEEQIDTVSSLVDDNVDEDTAEALELAADAMAFVQSLWNLFLSHGLVTDSKDPDLYKMEKVIDALYGEIAAMTLLFSHESFAMSKYLSQVITLLTTQGELLDKANGTSKIIPPEVIQGYKSFANRLKNAQQLKLAVSKENA